MRSYKPLTLFGSVAIALLLATLAFGSLPLWELIQQHRVVSRACAIIAISGFMLTCLSLALGLVLSSLVLVSSVSTVSAAALSLLTELIAALTGADTLVELGSGT